VLEFAIREDLNKRALRRLAVLRPIKVVITNYPEGKIEELDATNNPEDETAGKRKVPFSRELYIERDDFAEVPPPKFFRLKPGGEVRLKYAYIIKCDEVVKGRERQHHGTPLHRRSRQQDGRRDGRAAKSKAPSIGSAPRTPWTPKCASTTACSPQPNPKKTAAISNPC
jgi:glutaminyl-tRNA synthetase